MLLKLTTTCNLKVNGLSHVIALLTSVKTCVQKLFTISYVAASLITTSTVHSKLDYCNSLYCNLPRSQLHRLQLIQNSLAHAVVWAPRFTDTTPILKSLHWLKINERIEYKILSRTFKLVNNWHQVMMQQSIVQPSITTVGPTVQPADMPPPQSATLGLHPVASKLLLIYRHAKNRRLS